MELCRCGTQATAVCGTCRALTCAQHFEANASSYRVSEAIYALAGPAFLTTGQDPRAPERRLVTSERAQVFASAARPRSDPNSTICVWCVWCVWDNAWEHALKWLVPELPTDPVARALTLAADQRFGVVPAPVCPSGSSRRPGRGPHPRTDCPPSPSRSPGSASTPAPTCRCPRR